MSKVLTRLAATAVAAALASTLGVSTAMAGTVGTDGKPITNRAGVTFGVQAHRGGADEHPQNSLEAIDFTVQQGFDAIEIDLSFTKDDRPVLSHYDTLPDRCSSAGKKIHLMTWAEVQKVRCEDMDGNLTVPIPDFYQFNAAIAKNSSVKITLDIKGYSGQSAASKRHYAEKTIWLVKNYGLLNRTSILTFYWSTVLPTIRKKAPKIYVLALDNQKMDLARVRKAAKLGANGYGIKTKDTSAFLLRYIKAQGMDASPWEVKGETQRSFAIYFGGKRQFFLTDSPTKTRKGLVSGKYDLNPSRTSAVTTLAAPVPVLQSTLKAKKKVYQRIVGKAVPADRLIMLESVTVRVTVTNGPGKGYLSVSPAGSLSSSEVRRKLPRGTKSYFIKVPAGDGGSLRVFTSKKATVKLEVLDYTNASFA